METLTKCCSKCKEVKGLDRFSKDKKNKDGMQYSCKDCHKKYLESDKYLEFINSDKYKETRKKYYQSDKGKTTQKKYDQSDKGKNVRKKYYETDNGTVMDIKKRLKNYHNITNPPQELIECKLLIIKTKRLCKTLNN